MEFGVLAGRGRLLYVLAAPRPEIGPDHLDRDLRMVKSFYGFGSSIDPIKEVVLQELNR